MIEGGWTQTVFDAEAEALVTFTSGSAEQEIGLGDRSQWQNFRSGITLGVDHIKTGPDHIMVVRLPRAFVVIAGLTVVAAVVRWESGRRQALVATA